MTRTDERRAELLAVALELMAERGYHGASLRELAKRLGISQPSLYHYFSSKDELVEQIIEAYSARMLVGAPPFSGDLTQLPDALRRYVFALYRDRAHPVFVRFMFSISRIKPRFGRLNREIFVDRPRAAFGPVIEAQAARHGLDPERVANVLTAVINGIGFRLMEETVLFDERPISEETHAYAREISAMASHWLATLIAEARGGRPAPALVDPDAAK